MLDRAYARLVLHWASSMCVQEVILVLGVNDSRSGSNLTNYILCCTVEVLITDPRSVVHVLYLFQLDIIEIFKGLMCNLGG